MDSYRYKFIQERLRNSFTVLVTPAGVLPAIQSLQGLLEGVRGAPREGLDPPTNHRLDMSHRSRHEEGGECARCYSTMHRRA